MKENKVFFNEVKLDENRLLDDNSLEELGLIKQLNVTELINETQEKEKKKKLIISDLLYGGAVMCALIIQFNILLRMNIIVWVVINSFSSLLIPLTMLPKLQKRIKGGMIS
ncbi:hypothetical protein [Clostridium fungisolvens]|uniref:Uncharacterized protein n=1 Tax=Clostridium fungisolvens TaxID=1604897 RepID=A0A6V8SKH6_9CLOT|nr:hypothetical protein [Clostridium fungisolvens]GFP77734.1 hypothetical protein bsdtw1_03905 [Clostridium fungisolvens]